MKYIDEYRDAALVKELAQAIAELNPPQMTIMEVCGTHTMAIGRFGIRQLLPQQIKLISGPGCPVCVTPQSDIDAFLTLAKLPGIAIASFGDMLRVPGTHASLESERTRGADVRIVYSPLDAVEAARRTPEREIVFFGVGFETTTPAAAVAIKTAREEGIPNFSVFSAHKTIPNALSALLSDDGPRVRGFLLPGHVSVILGSKSYFALARDYGVSCVISGFEPVDIMQSVLFLARQAVNNRSEVENQYKRVVTEFGNPAALKVVDEVFEPCDAEWRGIGKIPGTGLCIRSDYAGYDASAKFSITVPDDSREPEGCLCGEMLKGRLQPPDCPLFGADCTPAHPVGPCMVSSEGTCAAWHRYERS